MIILNFKKIGNLQILITSGKQQLLMINCQWLMRKKLIIHHYKDVPEYCYSADIEEVRKNDYSLVPSKYIEFINRDENIDFDNKMKTLQTELSILFKEQQKSDEQLKTVFNELGYEIN